MLKPSFLIILCGIGFFLPFGCIVHRHDSNENKPIGLYRNIVPMGIASQYLLFDTGGEAFYFYDTTAPCERIEKKIRENFIRKGEFRIIGDSIKAALDSCVVTSSVGYVMIDGIKQQYKYRTYKYQKQRLLGKYSADSISFKVTTNDNFRTDEIYVRCK